MKNIFSTFMVMLFVVISSAAFSENCSNFPDTVVYKVEGYERGTMLVTAISKDFTFSVNAPRLYGVEGKKVISNCGNAVENEKIFLTKENTTKTSWFFMCDNVEAEHWLVALAFKPKDGPAITGCVITAVKL